MGTVTISMKKTVRIISFLILIFLLGGLGGIFFERFALPQLLATPFLQKLGLLDSVAERTTIINRTEQVVVQEDSSVEGVIAQPETTVVTLFYPEERSGRTLVPGTMRSGVLMTNDGVLATYMPDAAGQSLPEAVFADGSHHELMLLGYDAYTRLAFYKTKQDTNTASIQVGNSDDIQTGKKVIALRNTDKPGSADIFLSVIASRDHTYSLSGQVVHSSEDWEGVFMVSGLNDQTFAGSPLIGLTGEMAGIVGVSQDADGEHAFLIPSNIVKKSLEKAVAGSLDQLPTFGVHYRTLTPFHPSLEGNITAGALLQAPSPQAAAVAPGSPAAKAGLRTGDIITKINDTEITLDQPLPSLLYDAAAGQTLSVTYLRGGQEQTAQVSL